MRRIFEKIQDYKLVPVVKINKVENAVPLAKALCKGGLPIAEVTFRTACAKEAIAKITQEVPEMLVGAGTVLSTAQVDEVIASGASFVVSPGFNEKVVQYCMERGILIIPGCSNPSDMERAIEQGLEVVKFFPARELGGLATIKALAAPYQQLRFMPTGGITESTLNDYLDFEKIIACGGSWMVKESLVDAGDFEAIEELTRQAVRLMEERNTSCCEMATTKQECNQLVEKDLYTQSSQVIDRSEYPKDGKISRVASLGEILLRLSTPGYIRFQQAKDFEATFGGAEANIAVALSNFGMESRFLTKLPDNELGQSAINELRKFGVDTQYVVRGGERIGIYFLEKGASQRASKVVYDRAHSAMSEATVEAFDLEASLEGVTHFFVTGITPALGEQVAKLTLEACKMCKQKGIKVWCDLNYREKLWSQEEARHTLQELMQYVDVCITNEHHASAILEVERNEALDQEARLTSVAKQIVDKYGVQTVALTIRKSISASDNHISALLYQEGVSYFAKEYAMHIVDRVGGGDAFAAGLIYGMDQGYSMQAVVEFGTAAECLKHTIEGDLNHVTVKEVQELATGDGLGLVKR